MADRPDLDQVVEARRKLSAYAGFPRTYWALHGIALVLIAGLPIWISFLPGQRSYAEWVLLAVALASAAYSVIRRRRSGVALPRRIDAYPSARRPRFTVLALTAASVCALYALVENDHRVVAMIVLIPVVAFIFVGQIWTRAKMRDDIAAGRIAR